MNQRDPFVVTTPDVDPGFCPICSGRIDATAVALAPGYVDFSCEACGDVRLDLGKHRNGRGFFEHLSTAVSQYDSSDSSPVQSKRSGAEEFRRRMSDFIAGLRKAEGRSGRVAVGGTFEPTGTDSIQVGGLPGVTSFDLIVEGGRPPNVSVFIPEA